MIDASTIDRNIVSTKELQAEPEIGRDAARGLDEADAPTFERVLLSAHKSAVIKMIQEQPSLINDFIGDKTPFEIALGKGYTHLARILADFEHFDLNTAGHEPLGICLELGLTNLAVDLLKRGANPNIVKNGQSLLLLCLSKGDAETAELLLEYGAEIDFRDEKGWSALIHASFKGWVPEMEFLLSHGASVNLCTNEGWNALAVAYAYGHAEIVEKLQKAGGKFGEFFARAALLQAYKNRDFAIAKRLLDQGVSPDFSYDESNSLASRAAMDNEWSFVSECIQHGANPNFRINKTFPLIAQAIKMGQKDVVKLLIEKGASVNMTVGDHRRPLIVHACFENRSDIVELLLDKGACIDASDNKGNTALIIAVYFEYNALATFLLERGANPEKQDSEGKKAIKYCDDYKMKQLLQKNH